MTLTWSDKCLKDHCLVGILFSLHRSLFRVFYTEIRKGHFQCMNIHEPGLQKNSRIRNNATTHCAEFEAVGSLGNIANNGSQNSFIHYLFDTSRIYTMVKITLKQNYNYMSDKMHKLI